ncbi:MAG: ATP-binding cassette domain-containing protein [Phycisphaeraceae bacterium]|nr:ATP-binding cassette domain-containing protein [Phycisphaeraceae bacterium]
MTAAANLSAPLRTPMSNAVAIKGLTKTFGPKAAVRDLDLVVPTGSLCGFIGPNGAGKTTTIRMIMSIIFPDRGELSVLGRDSADQSKDRIGYLPEERGVYRKMKVAAFLTYMARLKGVDGGAMLKRKVHGWLERMGLAESARKRCEELSKGMQQKVQFIAAVIHEPDLLILDEVFSGLDPVNRKLMRTLIDEQHRAGRTIIFSTHAMYEAEQLCDRLFMIHHGVKVLDSTLAEIQSRFDPRTVIIEPLAETDAGRAEAALAAVAGVDSLRRTREGFEVHIEAGADARAVMGLLVREVPVRKVELKRVTLEDVFISLVEGTPIAAGESAEDLRAAVAAPGVEGVAT